MAISERDMEHVFERLRSGVVPERGLEMFAVGSPNVGFHSAHLLNQCDGSLA